MRWIPLALSALVATAALQGTAGQSQGPPGQKAGQGAVSLLFHEAWTRAPLTQPMVQANLGNQHLTLHIYGDASEIRKTMHPADDYTYTGETTSNWALTVSDKSSHWDLTGNARIRLVTKNSGYRFLHVVTKTADGRYYVSEEGSPSPVRGSNATTSSATALAQSDDDRYPDQRQQSPAAESEAGADHSDLASHAGSDEGRGGRLQRLDGRRLDPVDVTRQVVRFVWESRAASVACRRTQHEGRKVVKFKKKSISLHVLQPFTASRWMFSDESRHLPLAACAARRSVRSPPGRPAASPFPARGACGARFPNLDDVGLQPLRRVSESSRRRRVIGLCVPLRDGFRHLVEHPHERVTVFDEQRRPSASRAGSTMGGWETGGGRRRAAHM